MNSFRYEITNERRFFLKGKKPIVSFSEDGHRQTLPNTSFSLALKKNREGSLWTVEAPLWTQKKGHKTVTKQSAHSTTAICCDFDKGNHSLEELIALLNERFSSCYYEIYPTTTPGHYRAYVKIKRYGKPEVYRTIVRMYLLSIGADPMTAEVMTLVPIPGAWNHNKWTITDPGTPTQEYPCYEHEGGEADLEEVLEDLMPPDLRGALKGRDGYYPLRQKNSLLKKNYRPDKRRKGDWDILLPLPEEQREHALKYLRRRTWELIGTARRIYKDKVRAIKKASSPKSDLPKKASKEKPFLFEQNRELFYYLAALTLSIYEKNKSKCRSHLNLPVAFLRKEARAAGYKFSNSTFSKVLDFIRAELSIVALPKRGGATEYGDTHAFFYKAAKAAPTTISSFRPLDLSFIVRSGLNTSKSAPKIDPQMAISSSWDVDLSLKLKFLRERPDLVPPKEREILLQKYPSLVPPTL